MPCVRRKREARGRSCFKRVVKSGDNRPRNGPPIDRNSLSLSTILTGLTRRAFALSFPRFCMAARSTRRAERSVMAGFGIGEALPRQEDLRFLTGRGRYTGDLHLPGQCHAVIVRSPHAYARIRGIDLEGARAAPGVLGVFSSQDIGTDLGTTSPTFKRRRPDGTPMFWRPHPGLARDLVRYVGDPVALVVAETLSQARDAADLAVVDYEALPAVTDPIAALRKDSPPVWPDCPDNVSHITELGDRAATEAAFRS